MKMSFSSRTIKAKLSMTTLFMAVALLASNGAITGLSAHAQAVAQNNEFQKIIADIEKEAQRRDAATAKAREAVESIGTLTPQVKAQLVAELTDTQKANDLIAAQAKAANNLKSAQDLAKSVNEKYDQYATSQAKGMLAKDGDQQKQSQQQLDGTAKDIQTKLDQKKSSGENTDDSQKQLDNLKKLIESIAAILASVVALILALVAGDFSQAGAIFLAIVGQLAQNLSSILNVQGGLQLMIGSISG